MFDCMEIKVKGGEGGNGGISFRREKFVPFGGPDGGDGGNGGSVIVAANASVSSLRSFRQRHLYRAEDGKNGMGKKKHGKSGENKTLLVPAGTIVSIVIQDGSTEVLTDLARVGQQIVVARGGGGGRGNTHYVSSVNQAPMIAQRGEPGEEKTIQLEMRLIADVGIIGYPNVGKSSLLAASSAAKPKIASYPFTTLEPILGVVELGQQWFVMADMPGLIEDAHLGRGLGHEFLRHIMRTRILIHLIDAGSATPRDDWHKVNRELALFDPSLAQKPQLVAVNKIDLPGVRERMDVIRADFNSVGVEPFFISAVTREGIPALMAEAFQRLQGVSTGRKDAEITPRVFHPQPRSSTGSVYKENDTFVVVAPELERLKTRDGVVTSELRWQLKQQLTRRGISKQLEKAGIKPGDKVRCGSLEWEW